MPNAASNKRNSKASKQLEETNRKLKEETQKLQTANSAGSSGSEQIDEASAYIAQFAADASVMMDKVHDSNTKEAKEQHRSLREAQTNQIPYCTRSLRQLKNFFSSYDLTGVPRFNQSQVVCDLCEDAVDKAVEVLEARYPKFAPRSR